MEASVSSVCGFPWSATRSRKLAVSRRHYGSDVNFSFTNLDNCKITSSRLRKRVSAINDVVSMGADPAQTEVTWQIAVGAIAGVTPFVVAGIEFSKRIIAQRKCEVCGGSGLVQREKDYFRCPSCGGFLPWQSWKRFFSG